MSAVGDLVRDALQIVTRLAPWPTDTGLRRVGAPGEFSPVIVTGNYDLTVRRVMRALRGTDAWVVVAPSAGINVWCAAAGGHFATHHVVTALKTSGVAERVKHRRAILPQLAATGVIARDVSRRCGWRVHFGPVYADDLPRYLAANREKTDDMRHVHFDWRERLEMAGVWAGPSALVVGAVTWFLRPEWTLPLVGWCGLLAAAVFLAYDRTPGPRRAVFGAAACGVAFAAVAASGGGAAALFASVGVTAFLTAVLTFDYSGSTPVEGGTHFEERAWTISLDRERCRGVYRCVEVCPEAVFDRGVDERKAVLAREESCVRCGACIVQCPMDALAFEADDGRRVGPETIRRFKLNLLGRRAVDAGPGDADRPS